MRRKNSGRLRAYAVQAAPKPPRKVIRFKCRNCGQKVLVDAALRREAIACPTCQNTVVAPRPGRLWLEMVGAVLIFLIGLALGRASDRPVPLPSASQAIIMKDGGANPATSPATGPKPHWYSAASD